MGFGAALLAVALTGQLDSRIMVKEVTGGISGTETLQWQINDDGRCATFAVGTDGFITKLGEGKLKIADANRLKAKLSKLGIESLPERMGDKKSKGGIGYHCVTIQVGGTRRVGYCNNHPRLNGTLAENVEESKHGYADVDKMKIAAEFADIVIEACTQRSKR